MDTYIAPIWAVVDSSAQQFAERFYNSIIGGESVGSAMLSARQALDHPDGLAYVAFCDPSQELFVFHPRMTAGPYINERGISRVIEIEREYSAMELLAVNDLPWVLWDEEDVVRWTSRLPLSVENRERSALMLSDYLSEFGRRVHDGKYLISVVNAVMLKEYLVQRGRGRAAQLVRTFFEFSSTGTFLMLLHEYDYGEFEEIELVSKSPSMPPDPRQCLYVFNKQTRFEASPLTYNLFEEHSTEMIEYYIGRFGALLAQTLREYGKDDELLFGPDKPADFSDLNSMTLARLDALMRQLEEGSSG